MLNPNPLSDNALISRADLQAAMHALFAPVKPRFSPGAACVRLGFSGAHFDNAAAELEGFSRPLWGLAPLAAGGADFDGWALYRRGLSNGSDPQHPEYWGKPADNDQRLVEMAAIGFALALAPREAWEPLEPRAKENLARWLLEINRREMPDCNWLFFRVLVNVGLANVGAEHDPAAMHAALDRLETFYLGDGWYSDGPNARRDYYIPFAMHFYGLLYARLAGASDPQRAQRFRERAALFAQDFIHWFDADGAALPFGRSLTYRFAQGALWGALAFADVEALPWGVMKGLALRHLRWWSRRPIFEPDGTLSIGYGYPNLNMAEQYNSPGSPYWAMKFFIPLALPESHPFWQAQEAPLPDLPSSHTLPHAGMVMGRDPGSRHVFALTGGQHMLWSLHGAEKYAKFAYSTAFAFSVPAGGYGLEQAAVDSMLALSEDGQHYRVREEPQEARIDDSGLLYSRWQPWPDVQVETWLILALPWHVRLHRLSCTRPLWSAEGGFALDRTGDNLSDWRQEEDAGFALARSPAGLSGLRDLQAQRTGQVLRVFPNTNLLLPRTVIPTLLGQHAPGEHWLACAVLAAPDPATVETSWPTPPWPELLANLMKDKV
jgi:hypothetical protein